MNTKLAKVRRDGALKMKDISPQTRKMCKRWITGLGEDWTPWARLCDRHEHIGDYATSRAPSWSLLMKDMNSLRKGRSCWKRILLKRLAFIRCIYVYICVLKPLPERVSELNCLENNPKKEFGWCVLKTCWLRTCFLSPWQRCKTAAPRSFSQTQPPQPHQLLLQHAHNQSRLSLPRSARGTRETCTCPAFVIALLWNGTKWGPWLERNDLEERDMISNYCISMYLGTNVTWNQNPKLYVCKIYMCICIHAYIYI